MWMSFKLTLPLTAWLQQVNLNKLILVSVLLSLTACWGSQVCLQWVRKNCNLYFTAEYTTFVHTHTHVPFNPIYLSPLCLSHHQEAVLCQRENQPVQAAPRQAECWAGPAGQPAAVPPGCHLQAGQVVCAAPCSVLPPRQEFLPR